MKFGTSLYSTSMVLGNGCARVAGTSRVFLRFDRVDEDDPGVAAVGVGGGHAACCLLQAHITDTVFVNDVAASPVNCFWRWMAMPVSLNPSQVQSRSMLNDSTHNQWFRSSPWVAKVSDELSGAMVLRMRLLQPNWIRSAGLADQLRPLKSRPSCAARRCIKSALAHLFAFDGER